MALGAQEPTCGQISDYLLASYNAFHQLSTHDCGVRLIQCHAQAPEKLLTNVSMTTSVPHAVNYLPTWLASCYMSTLILLYSPLPYPCALSQWPRIPTEYDPGRGTFRMSAEGKLFQICSVMQEGALVREWSISHA